MADETVCATLLLKHLHRRSAGGFACEPIFSHLLSKRTCEIDDDCGSPRTVANTTVALNLISRDTLALWRLSRQQTGFDQLTLTANCQTRESLVPLTLGYLGPAVEPLRQQF
jgi:hypothetical protein